MNDKIPKINFNIDQAVKNIKIDVSNIDINKVDIQNTVQKLNAKVPKNVNITISPNITQQTIANIKISPNIMQTQQNISIPANVLDNISKTAATISQQQAHITASPIPPTMPQHATEPTTSYYDISSGEFIGEEPENIPQPDTSETYTQQQTNFSETNNIIRDSWHEVMVDRIWENIHDSGFLRYGIATNPDNFDSVVQEAISTLSEPGTTGMWKIEARHTLEDAVTANPQLQADIVMTSMHMEGSYVLDSKTVNSLKQELNIEKIIDSEELDSIMNASIFAPDDPNRTFQEDFNALMHGHNILHSDLKHYGAELLEHYNTNYIPGLLDQYDALQDKIAEIDAHLQTVTSQIAEVEQAIFTQGKTPDEVIDIVNKAEIVKADIETIQQLEHIPQQYENVKRQIAHALKINPEDIENVQTLLAKYQDKIQSDPVLQQKVAELQKLEEDLKKYNNAMQNVTTQLQIQANEAEQFATHFNTLHQLVTEAQETSKELVELTTKANNIRTVVNEYTKLLYENMPAYVRHEIEGIVDVNMFSENSPINRAAVEQVIYFANKAGWHMEDVSRMVFQNPDVMVALRTAYITKGKYIVPPNRFTMEKLVGERAKKVLSQILEHTTDPNKILAYAASIKEKYGVAGQLVADHIIAHTVSLANGYVLLKAQLELSHVDVTSYTAMARYLKTHSQSGQAATARVFLKTLGVDLDKASEQEIAIALRKMNTIHKAVRKNKTFKKVAKRFEKLNKVKMVDHDYLVLDRIIDNAPDLETAVKESMKYVMRQVALEFLKATGVNIKTYGKRFIIKQLNETTAGEALKTLARDTKLFMAKTANTAISSAAGIGTFTLKTFMNVDGNVFEFSLIISNTLWDKLQATIMANEFLKIRVLYAEQWLKNKALLAAEYFSAIAARNQMVANILLSARMGIMYVKGAFYFLFKGLGDVASMYYKAFKFIAITPFKASAGMLKIARIATYKLGRPAFAFLRRIGVFKFARAFTKGIGRFATRGVQLKRKWDRFKKQFDQFMENPIEYAFKQLVVKRAARATMKVGKKLVKATGKIAMQTARLAAHALLAIMNFLISVVVAIASAIGWLGMLIAILLILLVILLGLFGFGAPNTVGWTEVTVDNVMLTLLTRRYSIASIDPINTWLSIQAHEGDLPFPEKFYSGKNKGFLNIDGKELYYSFDIPGEQYLTYLSQIQDAAAQLQEITNVTDTYMNQVQPIIKEIMGGSNYGISTDTSPYVEEYGKYLNINGTARTTTYENLTSYYATTDYYRDVIPYDGKKGYMLFSNYDLNVIIHTHPRVIFTNDPFNPKLINMNGNVKKMLRLFKEYHNNEPLNTYAGYGPDGTKHDGNYVGVQFLPGVTYSDGIWYLDKIEAAQQPGQNNIYHFTQIGRIEASYSYYDAASNVVIPDKKQCNLHNSHSKIIFECYNIGGRGNASIHLVKSGYIVYRGRIIIYTPKGNLHFNVGYIVPDVAKHVYDSPLSLDLVSMMSAVTKLELYKEVTLNRIAAVFNNTVRFGQMVEATYYNIDSSLDQQEDVAKMLMSIQDAMTNSFGHKKIGTMWTYQSPLMGFAFGPDYNILDGKKYLSNGYKKVLQDMYMVWVNRDKNELYLDSRSAINTMLYMLNYAAYKSVLNHGVCSPKAAETELAWNICDKAPGDIVGGINAITQPFVGKLNEFNFVNGSEKKAFKTLADVARYSFGQQNNNNLVFNIDSPGVTLFGGSKTSFSQSLMVYSLYQLYLHMKLAETARLQKQVASSPYLGVEAIHFDVDPIAKWLPSDEASQWNSIKQRIFRYIMEHGWSRTIYNVIGQMGNFLEGIIQSIFGKSASIETQLVEKYYLDLIASNVDIDTAVGLWKGENSAYNKSINILEENASLFSNLYNLPAWAGIIPINPQFLTDSNKKVRQLRNGLLNSYYDGIMADKGTMGLIIPEMSLMQKDLTTDDSDQKFGFAGPIIVADQADKSELTDIFHTLAYKTVPPITKGWKNYGEFKLNGLNVGDIVVVHTLAEKEEDISKAGIPTLALLDRLPRLDTGASWISLYQLVLAYKVRYDKPSETWAEFAPKHEAVREEVKEFVDSYTPPPNCFVSVIEEGADTTYIDFASPINIPTNLMYTTYYDTSFGIEYNKSTYSDADIKRDEFAKITLPSNDVNTVFNDALLQAIMSNSKISRPWSSGNEIANTGIESYLDTKEVKTKANTDAYRWTITLTCCHTNEEGKRVCDDPVTLAKYKADYESKEFTLNSYTSKDKDYFDGLEYVKLAENIDKMRYPVTDAYSALRASYYHPVPMLGNIMTITDVFMKILPSISSVQQVMTGALLMVNRDMISQVNKYSPSQWTTLRWSTDSMNITDDFSLSKDLSIDKITFDKAQNMLKVQSTVKSVVEIKCDNNSAIGGGMCSETSTTVVRNDKIIGAMLGYGVNNITVNNDEPQLSSTQTIVANLKNNVNSYKDMLWYHYLINNKLIETPVESRKYVKTYHQYTFAWNYIPTLLGSIYLGFSGINNFAEGTWDIGEQSMSKEQYFDIVKFAWSTPYTNTRAVLKDNLKLSLPVYIGKYATYPQVEKPVKDWQTEQSYQAMLQDQQNIKRLDVYAISRLVPNTYPVSPIFVFSAERFKNGAKPLHVPVPIDVLFIYTNNDDVPLRKYFEKKEKENVFTQLAGRYNDPHVKELLLKRVIGDAAFNAIMENLDEEEKAKYLSMVKVETVPYKVTDYRTSGAIRTTMSAYLIRLLIPGYIAVPIAFDSAGYKAIYQLYDSTSFVGADFFTSSDFYNVDTHQGADLRGTYLKFLKGTSKHYTDLVRYALNTHRNALKYSKGPDFVDAMAYVGYPFSFPVYQYALLYSSDKGLDKIIPSGAALERAETEALKEYQETEDGSNNDNNNKDLLKDLLDKVGKQKPGESKRAWEELFPIAANAWNKMYQVSVSFADYYAWQNFEALLTVAKYKAATNSGYSYSYFSPTADMMNLIIYTDPLLQKALVDVDQYVDELTKLTPESYAFEIDSNHVFYPVWAGGEFWVPYTGTITMSDGTQIYFRQPVDDAGHHGSVGLSLYGVALWATMFDPKIEAFMSVGTKWDVNKWRNTLRTQASLWDEILRSDSMLHNRIGTQELAKIESAMQLKDIPDNKTFDKIASQLPWRTEISPIFTNLAQYNWKNAPGKMSFERVVIVNGGSSINDIHLRREGIENWSPYWKMLSPYYNVSSNYPFANITVWYYNNDVRLKAFYDGRYSAGGDLSKPESTDEDATNEEYKYFRIFTPIPAEYMVGRFYGDLFDIQFVWGSLWH